MNPARTGEHPSPEEVDAILEPAGGAPGVVAHVESCARCRATRDGLAHVRALLREESARVPEPPSGLGDRITAALGAEPARAGLVVPLAPRRRLPARWRQAAARIAVLGAGAAVAVQLASFGGGEVSTASQGGAESAPLGAEDSAGGDAGASGPVPGDSQPGAAAPAPDGAGDSQDARAAVEAEAEAGTAVVALATGTDYEPSRLPAQVSALVSTSPPPSPVGAAAGDRSLAEPARLDACLQGLGAAGTEPVAVDLARWRGTDAAVLVLPAPGGDGAMQVWVVARGCGPDRPGVMHSEQVAR